MDNAEEVMQSLEEFSKLRPKDIPHELDDYLVYVAKTGDPVFKWSIIKCFFREKLVNVITDFYESTLTIELPPCPNVDSFNYERMKSNLLEKLDSFHGAPFTVQRISELLTNPRKEYNRADKFMRAIEKNILVVSTREPGRVSEGESEAETAYNGLPEANETVFPPCGNELTDPDSSSQQFEGPPAVAEPAYSASGEPAPEEQPAQGTFLAAQAPREPPDLEMPSTSVETTAEDICSTLPAAPAEVTPEEPEQAAEAVPSTSEALPAEAPAPPALPEPSTSKHETCLPEEAPSSSQPAQPTTEPPAPAAAELAPAPEPSSPPEADAKNEALPAAATEQQPDPLAPSEANSFEDDRPVECDSLSDHPAEPQPAPATASEPEKPTDEQVISPEAEPSPVVEAVSTSEESEVTSCASSSDSANSDVVRETSVIHTTTADEPMEVDDCQPSESSEQLW